MEPIRLRLERRCKGCGATVTIKIEFDRFTLMKQPKPHAFMATEVAAFERLFEKHPFCAKCSAPKAAG